jgi:putative ABC transport system ATP-binding protein
VARALIHSPSVLFADEPTAPLHRNDRAQVLRTLSAAARSHGITVVLATHDLSLTEAARTTDATGALLADRTVALADGRRVPALPPGAAPLPDGTEGAAACSLSV